MSTLSPLERVNRLREETELAKTGDGPTLTGSWFAEPQHPHSAVFEVIAEDEGTIIVGWTDAPIGTHIARWDPDAAGKVLDLLEALIRDYESELHPCCIDDDPILAVLDQLDGGSTT